MDADKAVNVFISYSHAEKADFLAQLMYELTPVVRDNYESGQDGLTNARRVRRINEVRHRVSAFLLAVLRDNPQRYPDDVLVRIIIDHPDDEVVTRQSDGVFTRLAAQRLTPA